MTIRRVALIQLGVVVVVVGGLLTWAWGWPDVPEPEGLAFENLAIGEPAPRGGFEARDGVDLAYRAYEAPDSDTLVVAARVRVGEPLPRAAWRGHQ